VLPQVIPSSHNSSLFATNYTFLAVASKLTEHNKMANKNDFSIDDLVVIQGIQGYTDYLNGAGGTVYEKDKARYSVVGWDGTCLNIAAKNLALVPPRDENKATLKTNPSKKERSLEFYRYISEIYQTIRNTDGSHTSCLKSMGTFSSTIPSKLESDDCIMMMYAVMEYFKYFSGRHLSETELVLEWTIQCMIFNRKPKKYTKSQLKEMRQKIIAAHASFLSYKLQKEEKIDEQIRKEEKLDEEMSWNPSLVKEIGDIIFDQLLPEHLNSIRKLLSDPVTMKGLQLEVLEDESDSNVTFRVIGNLPIDDDNDDDKECAVTLKIELEKPKSITKPNSSRVLEEITRDQAENVDKMSGDDCNKDSKPGPSTDKEYTAKSLRQSDAMLKVTNHKLRESIDKLRSQVQDQAKTLDDSNGDLRLMDPGIQFTRSLMCSHSYPRFTATGRDALVRAISRTIDGGETPEAFINAVISRIVGSHRDVDFDEKRDVVKDIPRTAVISRMDEVKDSLRKRQKSRTIDDDDDDVLKEFKAPEKRRDNKYGLSIYNWCDFAEARLKKLKGEARPMGLRISSDFVQSCMEEIFHGLDVVVYINDLDVLYSHHDGGNDTLHRRLG
jgi:hypothetical protein